MCITFWCGIPFLPWSLSEGILSQVIQIFRRTSAFLAAEQDNLLAYLHGMRFHLLVPSIVLVNLSPGQFALYGTSGCWQCILVSSCSNMIGLMHDVNPFRMHEKASHICSGLKVSCEGVGVTVGALVHLSRCATVSPTLSHLVWPLECIQSLKYS